MGEKLFRYIVVFETDIMALNQEEAQGKAEWCERWNDANLRLMSVELDTTQPRPTEGEKFDDELRRAEVMEKGVDR